MLGAIAVAFYGIDYNLEDKMLEYLDPGLQSIYYSFDLIKRKTKKVI